MNVPNALSLTRVLLIPLFVILIMDEHFGWALVIYAIAGITDGLDGLIARVTHQRTELGAYIDPIADKMLITASFITLAIIQIIPNWLTVLVITRDVLIVIGLFVMILTDRHFKMGPSLASKVTTVFQISTIILTLMARCGLMDAKLVSFAVYGTAVFTIVSGFHYIYLAACIFNPKKN